MYVILSGVSIGYVTYKIPSISMYDKIECDTIPSITESEQGNRIEQNRIDLTSQGRSGRCPFYEFLLGVK